MKSKIARTNKTYAIASLTPNPKNPRTHSKSQIEKLAKSIEQFGWTAPIIVDENKMIIAGHGRFDAAQLAGIVKAPCVVISGMTATQKDALLIADNQLGDLSTWNEKRLDDVLQTLHVAEFPMADI
jgi:ParB/RepB/Spo0J family partition protein